MCPTTRVFPQALSCVAGYELFEFMRNPHLETMQESPLYSRNHPEKLWGQVNVTARKPSLLDVDADQTR